MNNANRLEDEDHVNFFTMSVKTDSSLHLIQVLNESKVCSS